MESGTTQSAMEAAKRGRADQLARLEAYEAGQEVAFISHQGASFPLKKKEDEDTRPRDPVKVVFDKKAVFLDAAAHSDEELVEKMLEEGMDPNVCNADGLTALHQSAIENNLKIAGILIRNGAKVNTRDHDLWTPLHAASACGHWRLVSFLLNNGADVAAVNADGDLPLDLAEGEKTEKLLWDKLDELDIGEEKRQALRDGLEDAFVAQVQKLLDEGKSINTKDPRHGGTALHVAACHDWAKALNFLFDHAVDVTAQDNEGNTALHLAAFFQNYKSVELLGKHGASADTRNRHKETPEVMTEDVAMIRMLKGIREKNVAQSSANLAKTESRRRLDSSVSRRSTAGKRDLVKADMMKEHKKIESNYAELTFGGKKKDKDKEKEKEKEKEKDADKETDKKKGAKLERKGTEANVMYSTLDFDNQKDGDKADSKNDTDKTEPAKTIEELQKEEAAKQEAAADMYASPKKVREEGAANPKLLTQQKKAEMRKKPSLAAIAVEGSQTTLGSEGDDDTSTPAAAASAEKAKGGCCTLQ
eukprot:m.92781 g.92781  ORF g.92781 m.92781 type:complete len:532 (+) comp18290_c0_seq1:84-1679(+)